MLKMNSQNLILLSGFFIAGIYVGYKIDENNINLVINYVNKINPLKQQNENCCEKKIVDPDMTTSSKFF
jgi:hypothetical protein